MVSFWRNAERSGDKSEAGQLPDLCVWLDWPTTVNFRGLPESLFANSMNEP